MTCGGVLFRPGRGDRGDRPPRRFGDGPPGGGYSESRFGSREGGGGFGRSGGDKVRFEPAFFWLADVQHLTSKGCEHSLEEDVFAHKIPYACPAVMAMMTADLHGLSCPAYSLLG